jgi:hypothetical protein
MRDYLDHNLEKEIEIANTPTFHQVTINSFKGDFSKDHPDYRVRLSIRLDAMLRQSVFDYEFNDISVL